MNFIQTLWTSPSRSKQRSQLNRFNGGWPSEKHHAISWAYSLESIKKFHPNNKVNLYTDSIGADWLIDKLKLPYDDVIISLDSFDYPTKFWALSKIHTYSLQQTPFLHIDGDVFIWEALSQDILSKNVIIQNKEVCRPMYMEILRDARIFLKNIPAIYDRNTDLHDLTAFCAGILGGSDISLIQKYCKISFDFVNSNINTLRKIEGFEGLNMFIEQLFLATLTWEKYKSWDEVGEIFNAEESSYYFTTRFALAPKISKFIHMGPGKKNRTYVSHMEERFKFDFPSASKRIDAIYKKPKLFYLNPNSNFYELNEFRNTKKELFDLTGKKVEIYKEQFKQYFHMTLEDYRHTPQYFYLQDIFQIESNWVSIQGMLEAEKLKSWDIQYNTTIEEFLNIRFSLNTTVCKIIYLYTKWEVDLNKNQLSIVRKKNESLSLDKTSLPLPWIITSSFDNVNFQYLYGWYKLILFFENQTTLSGWDIIKKLSENNVFEFNPDTIQNDIYIFLTTQYFLYNRLKIVEP